MSLRGEEVLHRMEADGVLRLLEREDPYVAGLAASVVTDAEVRRRVRSDAFGVYLFASIETLVKRVGSGEGRPWLKPDPETALRRLFEGRNELYRETARIVVDVDDLEPDQAASEVLTALGRT